jgi:rSAM/selenodomain-associated transferase 1
MTSCNKQKPTQSRGHGSGSCAIGALIKAPRIGFSKTRLCPPLEPPDCKALSRCFIQDTAENVSAFAWANEGIVPVAIYTPVGSEPDVQQLLPSKFLLIPQRGECLGDRLFHAAQDLFQRGFDSVCLLGSDGPTLPPSYLGQMVEVLRRSKDGVVIGPTLDGGYYAIGLKNPCRRLFEDIEWSTDRVFKQTQARIAELALSQMTLPVRYDVDDGAALGRLIADLSRDHSSPRSSSAYSAAHTRRLLNSILLRKGHI